MDDRRLQHRFRVKDGALSCTDCGTAWGEGPADCTATARGGTGDPYAQRLHELTAEAKQVAAGPDVGEPEVRRLEQILAEAQRILDESGVTAEQRRRARLHRAPAGRAIDIPPRRDLFDWIRTHYALPDPDRPRRWNIFNPRYRPGYGEYTHWAGRDSRPADESTSG